MGLSLPSSPRESAALHPRNDHDIGSLIVHRSRIGDDLIEPNGQRGPKMDRAVECRSVTTTFGIDICAMLEQESNSGQNIDLCILRLIASSSLCGTAVTVL